MNAIILSAGEVLGSMLFGFLGVRFTLRSGRHPVVVLGCVTSLATYTLMFLNFPMDANNDQETEHVSFINPPSKAVALVASFLLGFSDACFNTQVFTHLQYTRF